MKLHTLVLLLVAIAIAIFVMLNWSVFVVPTDLSLGVMTIKMPLGLLMVGLLIFVSALFLVYVAYLKSSALLETRRHLRELQAHRERADQAETSRLAELRNFLEAEMAKQANRNTEIKSDVIARVEKLDHDLRNIIEASGNTLAAYIGELEDRMEKKRTPTSGG